MEFLFLPARTIILIHKQSLISTSGLLSISCLSHFYMNVPCFVKVSIDDDRAYGLVLQREIALFRESRDGTDVEVGALSF